MTKQCKRLALFFNEGVSLLDWAQAGTLERDIELYRRLVEHGYHTTFITYGDERDREVLPPDSGLDAAVKPEGMPNDTYGRRIAAIHHGVLASTDVIKSHQVRGARFAARAKHRLRKPYIARCGYLRSVFARHQGRGWRERFYYWREEFFSFHSADVVCVPSQSEIAYLRRHYGIPARKMAACPNWIDVDIFHPDENIPKRERQICFVGRFAAQKDPLTLIEAVRGLHDVELVMIGGGELRGKMAEMVDAYHVRATLLDRVPNDELPRYLCESAIFALPTRFEGGSPKTLLEAMACGLPVISTSAFGADSAFEDGVHGCKVRPGDVQTLQEAIQALMADPAKRRQMGEAGRQHILAHYSVDQAVRREVAILGKLAGLP
jgi:glycosyltransferase involved in cell wall biosynthesis